MSVWIDPPTWSAHGRLWSHLASDTSYAELHTFADRARLPRQAFDRDHYDVPQQAYDALVAAGAQPVSSRELVRRLADAGLRARRACTPGRRRPGQALLRPRRLVPGDRVNVVAASGPVRRDRLGPGLDLLRSWGLQVRTLPTVDSVHPRLGHLAAPDHQRAAEVVEAWTDPDAAAVWCARGGDGAHRVVDLLDWTAMAAAGPRMLIGFSDVTGLHEAVNGRLGTLSIHGPVVISLADASPPARECVRRFLMRPEQALGLADGLRAMTTGAATGVLVGGNLRVLTAGVGTRLHRTARGGIAVLEDVNEEPYRVDAMLTQLRRTGWFDGVRGVVVGAFTETGDTSPALAAVLRDRLDDLGVPVVTGAPVGHVPDNLPVPLGAAAVLDADAGTLRLVRPALR